QRESGGIAAVLAHVAAKQFAATRARDYVELLADPTLSAQDYARVLQAVRATEDSPALPPASIITSGTGTPPRNPSRMFEAMGAGEDFSGPRWHRVLRSAVAYAPGLPPRSQAALVAAVMQLPPDAISLDLLRDVAHAATLDEPLVADAFYGVMRGAPAGSPASTLPLLVVQDPSLLATVTAGAIRAGRGQNEADRVRLLLAVPLACLRSPTVRAAYSQAMQGVTYDVDRLRVQSHLQQATATRWEGRPPACGRG
ncbi:MAG TPA: hypothetical protein VFH27_06475, partial [Longimicrobiaceae bacterium]|nr:hypothetical protein [Longimicrobiaceae bacterium]